MQKEHKVDQKYKKEIRKEQKRKRKKKFKYKREENYKEMIHSLPTITTHDTPFNKSESPTSQNVTREYLTPSCSPNL